MVRSVLRLGLSIDVSQLDFLGRIASFELRLRGAAQMALSLPYPFRTWPGSGTWAERNKREVHKFWVFFWAVYPRGLHIHAEFEAKKHGKTLFSKLALFPICLHISSPRHFFPGHTSKRLACDGTIALSLLVDLVLHVQIPMFKNCFREGAFPTQRHQYTQCPR